MYFVNETHETNYFVSLLQFKVGPEEFDKQSACYVLAVPKIFNNVSHVLQEFSYPVEWIWRWEVVHGSLKYSNEDRPLVDYKLTDTMIELGRLSMNLYNGYSTLEDLSYFNLHDFINSLDQTNISILKCAIDLRVGYFQNTLQ